MLVTRKNLARVVGELKRAPKIALDTETTGLHPYQGDRLFSLILADGNLSYYFNFLGYEGLGLEWVLDKYETFGLLKQVFGDRNKLYYMHNAKFDLAMLDAEDIEVAGEVWDTEVGGRLLFNRHLRYGLGALAQEIGYEKNTVVEDYIKKHRVYTWLDSPGKKKKEKKPHYDRVPFELISRYGEDDGKITFALGEHQLVELEKVAGELPARLDARCLYANERSLVKTCFAMEREGILIDRDYCQQARSYELGEADKAAREFESLSGVSFKDSNKVLAAAFAAAGEKYPTTAKGSPSFTDKVLEGFTTPLAKCVQKHRAAMKKANTYYGNFLYYCDSDGRLHANIRQAGTDTGRFSYSSPNLQNIPKEEEGDWPVRRAFVPDPDHCFVMIDYDQQEYRLMLDYAGEMGVIRKILDDGLDVHTATAEMMGVSRTEAKSINFGLLYGQGAGKLADTLGLTVIEAREMIALYFAKLPKVERFIREVKKRARVRGRIASWSGRVYHFPIMNDSRTGGKSRFEYRAPNHLIQGGCADVVRYAMVRLDNYLKSLRSKMLLQVHDEIIFKLHKSELEIAPTLQAMMREAYPHRYLPMTCGVDHSFKSWADKVEGCP